MKFSMLTFLCVVVGILVANVQAIPTTISPITSLPDEIVTEGFSTDSTSTMNPEETTNPTETTSAPSTGLLRQPLPMVNRLRGRVVLANTRMEGSTEWGVTADEAELACNRIARYQSESNGSGMSLLHSFFERLFSTDSMKKQPQGPVMEGHLLSIGSSYEVLALSRLLSPLPDGAYWTGGKLVRYRVNSMHRHAHTDHVILTWTDGRVGQPSVLGLTQLDEEELNEGQTYCLALNLKEATWQARECEDRLPYACLITPRQIGFTKKAREDRLGMMSTETPQIQEEWITETTASTVGERNKFVKTLGKLFAQDANTQESTTSFATTESSMGTETVSTEEIGVSSEAAMTTDFIPQQPVTGDERFSSDRKKIERVMHAAGKRVGATTDKNDESDDNDDDDDDDEDEDRTQIKAANFKWIEGRTTESMNRVLSEVMTTQEIMPSTDATPTTMSTETTTKATVKLLNDQMGETTSPYTPGLTSDQYTTQLTGERQTSGEREEQNNGEIENSDD